MPRFALLTRAGWARYGFRVLFGLGFILNVYATREWAEPPISNDVGHYYAYLPGAFVHHDLTFSFLADTANVPDHWVIYADPLPTGGRVIKTTCGQALLWLPAWAVGHGAALVLGYPADGFSPPYFLAVVGWSALLFVAGCWLLARVIYTFVPKGVARLAIFVLWVGTNLLHYTLEEPLMAHATTFVLASVLLWLAHQWATRPQGRWLVLAGGLLGFMVLVRPTNVLYAAVWLGWVWAVGGHSIRTTWVSLITQWKGILGGVGLALLVWLPQLLYWKAITGHWLFASYQGEQFYWLSPHLSDFLFSYRKGWLLYTPLMLGALAGLVALWRTHRRLAGVLGVATGVAVYWLSTWWCWWYGGSFGMRAMIDFYPLLAIPLAAGLAYLWQRSRATRWAMGTLLVLCVAWNLFWKDRYQVALLHWDATSGAVFWANLKSRPTEAEIAPLLCHPNYEAALRGEDEPECP